MNDKKQDDVRSGIILKQCVDLTFSFHLLFVDFKKALNNVNSAFARKGILEKVVASPLVEYTLLALNIICCIKILIHNRVRKSCTLLLIPFCAHRWCSSYKKLSHLSPNSGVWGSDDICLLIHRIMALAKYLWRRKVEWKTMSSSLIRCAPRTQDSLNSWNTK